jgi:hypothetical protein
MKTGVDVASAEADGAQRKARAVAMHLRAARVHEQAAELHREAADYFERGAALDHNHGWEELASHLEQLADEQREAAAAQQAKADQERDILEREVLV